MQSKFDWHKDPLTVHTRIDEDYKTTQNVRRFFASQVEGKAAFTKEFMQWMKKNPGKTLGQAVAEYKRRKALDS
jgi:hypothetical protein